MICYTDIPEHPKWRLCSSKTVLCVCTLWRQGRRTAQSFSFFMVFRNSGMGGAARSSRWPLPDFASSFPTSAATTSAANPSA